MNRSQNYREKREMLKREFENRKLAKKINVDGYLCSLHDLTRNRLVFVCCRKTSTRCKIKIHITWDGLEQAGYKMEGNIRVTPDIKHMSIYEIKGRHSPECIAKHDYLERKAKLELEEEEDMPNPLVTQVITSNTPTGSASIYNNTHSQIEKSFCMTLDNAMYFRLQDSTISVRKDCKPKSYVKQDSLTDDALSDQIDSNIWNYRILLLGSRFMVKELMKCDEVLIDRMDMDLGNMTKNTLISIFGIDKNCDGVPGVYIFMEEFSEKLIQEGFRMLRREMSIINSDNNDLSMGLEQKIIHFKANQVNLGNLYYEMYWKKVYYYQEDQLSTIIRSQLKIPVSIGDFDLTWKLRKESVRLEIPKTNKLDLIISICQTFWNSGYDKINKFHEQLITLTNQENDYKLKTLVDYFVELQKKRNTPYETELYDLKEEKVSPEIKFKKMINKELAREKNKFETLYNILRFYEIEYRQKIISGAVVFEKYQDSKPQYVNMSGNNSIMTVYNDEKMNVNTSNDEMNIDIHADREIINEWEDTADTRPEYIDNQIRDKFDPRSFEPRADIHQMRVPF